MARTRDYRRMMAARKADRQRRLSEFIPFWRSVVWLEDTNRTREAFMAPRKRNIKKQASRIARRRPSDQLRGCGYKKIFSVEYELI